jgi:hypothetical protein
VRFLPVPVLPLALPGLTGAAGEHAEGGGPLAGEDRGREPSAIHAVPFAEHPPSGRGKNLP